MSGNTCVAVLISWNDWISFSIYIFLDNWCFCIRAISTVVFWKAVNYLAMFGLSVTFLSMDGAQSNRDFMNILLAHRGSGTFTIDNIDDPKRF